LVETRVRLLKNRNFLFCKDNDCKDFSTQSIKNRIHQKAREIF